MQHVKFHYASIEEVQKEAEALTAWLPLEEDVSVLLRPLAIPGGWRLQNRMAAQPMEGTDGTLDGSPTDLTARRYLRFAAGGVGLIWFEAVAVAPEIRASQHQLYLHEDNLPAYQRLVAQTKEACMTANGFEPVIILQATHSGRYSRPNGVPEPIIAYNNPLFEGDTPIDPSRIITDDALARYEECFAKTAKLAQAAGFDGIDIKTCHRYMISELLSAYERPGRYGGSFENRTRFLLNCHRAAAAAVKGRFLLTSRMNAYDGYPYPYGFGVSPDGGISPDLAEPIRLARTLVAEAHCSLLNVTIGNPYTNPHVNRPYDAGRYTPDEHPITGLSRMMRCVSAVQETIGDVPVVGSAFSYLRAFSPNLAAGMVAGKHAAIAGFGRMMFANPDFANQIRVDGRIETQKVCLCCGQCAQLLRAGAPAGCPVRDREMYVQKF